MTRRPRGREERSVGASIALHGTLLMAVTIALFPVVWVLLASLKPKSAIQSSEVALFDHPTLDNYHRVLFDTNFPHLVPQLGHRRGVHDARRDGDVGDRRLCAEPVQLPPASGA